MRIISQNGDFDIEYKNCHLIVNRKCFEIEAETNNPNFTPVMASYSSIEKCRKAMEMLHEAYCGAIYMKHADYEIDNIDLSQEFEKKIREFREKMLKPYFLDVNIKNPVIKCKAFRFPYDDEVEV